MTGRTFLAVDGESLADTIAAATPADTIHAAFAPPGHYPRLHVQGERWAVVSWSATDTNGRWTWDGKQVQHRPSPSDPDSLKCPETKSA